MNSKQYHVLTGRSVNQLELLRFTCIQLDTKEVKHVEIHIKLLLLFDKISLIEHMPTAKVHLIPRKQFLTDHRTLQCSL